MLQSSSSEKILVKPLKIDILGLHGLCSKWKTKKKAKTHYSDHKFSKNILILSKYHMFWLSYESFFHSMWCLFAKKGSFPAKIAMRLASKISFGWVHQPTK